MFLVNANDVLCHSKLPLKVSYLPLYHNHDLDILIRWKLTKPTLSKNTLILIAHHGVLKQIYPMFAHMLAHMIAHMNCRRSRYVWTNLPWMTLCSEKLIHYLIKVFWTRITINKLVINDNQCSSGWIFISIFSILIFSRMSMNHWML